MKFTCSLCRRTWIDRSHSNAEFGAGRVLSIICPGCESAAQNAEAAITDATLDYYANAFGPCVEKPKRGNW